MTGCPGCLGTVISHWESSKILRHSLRKKRFHAVQIHHTVALAATHSFVCGGGRSYCRWENNQPNWYSTEQVFSCISPSLLNSQIFTYYQWDTYHCPFNDIWIKRIPNIPNSFIQKTISLFFSLYVCKMKNHQLEIVATVGSESQVVNWTKQREMKEGAKRETKTLWTRGWRP